MVNYLSLWNKFIERSDFCQKCVAFKAVIHSRDLSIFFPTFKPERKFPINSARVTIKNSFWESLVKNQEGQVEALKLWDSLGFFSHFHLQKDGGKLLFDLAGKGHTKAVRYIIKRYLDKVQDFIDASFFLCVTQTGCSKTMRLVWQFLSPESKAKAFQPNEFGETSLHIAAKTGKRQVIETLEALYNTEKKIFVFQADNNGSTPLHIAVENGSLEAMQAINNLCVSEEIKNILLQSDKNGHTPLHLALMKCNDIEIIRFICCLYNTEPLKRIAFRPGWGGCNPLHIAIEKNDIEILKLILALCNTKHLKNVIIQPNEMGDTPLSLVIKEDNIEFLKLLCGQCSTESLKRVDWSSIFHKIVRLRNEEALKVLCELCVTEELKILAMQPFGFLTNKTPLHIAVELGDQKMIEFLCSFCDTEKVKEIVFRPDSAGFTPLHRAAESGGQGVIKALCNLCDTEHLRTIALQPNQYGTTPLHLAISWINIDDFELICNLCNTEKLKKIVSQSNDKGLTILDFCMLGRCRIEFFEKIIPLFSAEKLRNVDLLSNLFHQALKQVEIPIIKELCKLCNTENLKLQVLNYEKGENSLLQKAAKITDINFFEVLWGLCTTTYLKKEVLKEQDVLSLLLSTIQRMTPNIIADLLQFCPWEHLLRFEKSKISLGDFSSFDLYILLQIIAYHPTIDVEKKTLIKSYFLLKHDRLQEFDCLWQEVLKQEELTAKLLPLIVHNDPWLTQILLEQMGTVLIEKAMSLKGEVFHLSLLPLLKADVIVQKIQDLPIDQKIRALNQKITVENTTDTPKVILSYMYNEWACFIQWDKEEDSNTSRFILASLQNGFKQFSYVSLALLAQDEQNQQKLIASLPALSDFQLTIVIPQFSENTFIETLLYWKSVEKVFMILSKATIRQKHAFIDCYEKIVVEQPFKQLENDLALLKDRVNTASGEEFAQKKFGLQQRLAVMSIYLKRLDKIYREDDFTADGNRLFALQQDIELKRQSLQGLQSIMFQSEDIPEEYICPISGMLMEDPVIAPIGKIIYDRSSIMGWVKSILHSHNPFTDPLTRQPLLDEEEMQQPNALIVFEKKLKSAAELKEAIAAFKIKKD